MKITSQKRSAKNGDAQQEIEGDRERENERTCKQKNFEESEEKTRTVCNKYEESSSNYIGEFVFNYLHWRCV